MWKTVKSELSYIEKRDETTRTRIILGLLLFFLVLPFIMTVMFMIITKLGSNDDFDFMTVLKSTYMLSNTFLGFLFLFIICQTIYLEKRVKLWRVLPFTLKDMFLTTLKIRSLFLTGAFIISFITASIAYGKWLILTSYQYQQFFYLWSGIFAAIFISVLLSEIFKHDLSLILMIFLAPSILWEAMSNNNPSGELVVFNNPAPIVSSVMIIIGLIAIYLHWLYYQKRTSFMK